MKRYELVIKRGRRNIESKIVRANKMSSIVAECEDLLNKDTKITGIMITDMITDEVIIVK